MPIPAFEAAVFDMDGLLIDSEPLWREAEVTSYRAIGVEITDAMCLETLGMRPDEAVAYWYARCSWSHPAPAAVEAMIVDAVEALVAERGRALAGAHATIDLLHTAGMQLGLASSSPRRLIDAVLDRLGLRGRFAAVCSAAEEARGKPDPAVYRRACERLGAPPRRSVAFEDSPPGVHSAKAAGLAVVAVPAAHLSGSPLISAADLELASLGDVTLEVLARIAHARGKPIPCDVSPHAG